MHTRMHVLLSQVRGPFEGKVSVLSLWDPGVKLSPYLAGPVEILLIRAIELGRPTLSGLGSQTV